MYDNDYRYAEKQASFHEYYEALKTSLTDKNILYNVIVRARSEKKLKDQ